MSPRGGPRALGWTAALTALAVLATAWALLAGALEFDRSRLAAEPWRLLTGHWTHWSLGHLLWDAAMFAVLAGVLERRGRARLLACVLVAALVISAVLWVAEPGMTAYRGLSGIDAALFALAVGVLLRDALEARRWKLASLLVIPAVGFGAKIAYELGANECVFVDAPAGAPVPLVHVVGAAVGAAMALLPAGVFERAGARGFA